MRHAKAEQFAASDHDRVLTARGVADAAEAGQWVSGQGFLPDVAVVSSASRTQETWTSFAQAAGSDLVATTDRALYAADIDGVLEIIRNLSDDARTALVIGHNPTMELLVHYLDDGDSDPGVFAQVTAGYPTAALTVLQFSGGWETVGLAGARTVAFHVGRG